MKLVNNEKVINIIQSALDHIDPRLINHGNRVSYLVYKMIKYQNKYNDKSMRDICLLAMLHDIGAYKTEEIDRMVIFETVNIWEHSIYGFLFLKYFSPLKHMAPAILFHHADCCQLEYIHYSYRELAQIIFICDRFDVYTQLFNSPAGFIKYIENYRGITFHADIIDLFWAANKNLNLSTDAINSDMEYMNIMYNTPITAKEADDYIKMVIYSIDFRSQNTVIHTVTTACVSTMLGKLAGISESEIEKVTTGALLHDIGKMGIPKSILEKPGQLSADEMELMKTHVDLTEKIIRGSVDDEIRRIAVMHHEKLNGTGYPTGISSSDISIKERIIAVSDIFSALWSTRSYKDSYNKKMISDILNSMSRQGLIDSGLVTLSVKNIDTFINELERTSQPVIAMYKKLNSEYCRLKSEINMLLPSGM